MTVEELIEILKLLPSDAIVCNEYDGILYDIGNVDTKQRGGWSEEIASTGDVLVEIERL